jgi:acetoin utilization protein AcuB
MSLRPRRDDAMIVKDFMTTSPISVSPATPIAEARDLMVRRRIRHLLILHDERLVGIVTDRDVRLNLPSPASSLSVWEVNYLLTKLTAGEVMTKNVITVSPNQTMTEAARLMLEKKIGALPVVEGDRVVGILTETDVLRAFVGSQNNP